LDDLERPKRTLAEKNRFTEPNVPVYNGRSLYLTIQRDWLSRTVTHVRVTVRSHYLYAFCLLPPMLRWGANKWR